MSGHDVVQAIPVDPRLVVLAAGLAVFALILCLVVLFGRRRAAPAEPPKPAPPAVPPPKPAPPPAEAKAPYTYKDFMREILDDRVSISDILDRCGGSVPVDPAGTPPIAPAGIDRDRLAARLEWFRLMMAKNPAVPLVPPPPPPAPVFAFKGQIVPCDCRKSAEGGYPMRQYGSGPIRHGEKCRACGGTGFVVIHGT